MTKRTKQSPPVAETLTDRARSTIEKALGALDGRIDAIMSDLTQSTGKKKAYDQGAASHLAWLTKQVAQILGEVRKLEAAERKNNERITRGDVLAWLRALDKAERSSVVREAQAMDSERSVLG